MTMDDTRELLRQASTRAPAPGPDLNSLYQRRDTKVRRSRFVAIGVALAVAVGGSAVALHATTGRSERGAAGGIGAVTKNLQLDAGDYYFQRFNAGYGVCESWWAIDDSGRLGTVDHESNQGSCWGTKGGQTFGPGEFYSDSGPVAELSTDPEELLAQLSARVETGGASPEPYADWGGPIEWGLIRSLGELLEAPDVTPAQKAAMFDLAVQLGTSVETQAHDPEGRDAILVTLDSEHQTHQWWFDPSSHQLLDLDGFVVRSAGIVTSTDSTDLNRSFVPALHG